MVDALTLLHWGQVVVLAASLPLALVAAWGFREAPVGRPLAGLPLVSAGFLVAASAELVIPSDPAGGAWLLGGAVAAVGFVWFGLTFLRLASGKRRIGG